MYPENAFDFQYEFDGWDDFYDDLDYEYLGSLEDDELYYDREED
jgi:hypothetical protein